MTIEIPVWPYVYGAPSGVGKIRHAPEDFIVIENLAFEPSGQGEHAFLYIEKTGENTEFIARQLARFANVRQRDIGFAGLKDRHAMTRQWFSVWLPGKSDPDWTMFESDTIKVLQSVRHARKLKRGALSGNHFKITVRDWRGNQSTIVNQLETIKARGIANYYGEQRFGHGGHNVNKALALFSGAKVTREQRSLYVSAARSFLFNQILAQRVVNGSWNCAVSGDIYMFDRSHSCFAAQPDVDTEQRLKNSVIHPTGVLWGAAKNTVLNEVEQRVINQYSELSQGLLGCSVEMDRRPLRINVLDLQWRFVNDTVFTVEFGLPAGSYATALLREIIS